MFYRITVQKMFFHAKTKNFLFSSFPVYLMMVFIDFSTLSPSSESITIWSRFSFIIIIIIVVLIVNITFHSFVLASNIYCYLSFFCCRNSIIYYYESNISVWEKGSAIEMNLAIFSWHVALMNDPDCLKIAKVTPLHKAGSKQLVENYRPISVLPCLSKFFKRLVNDRLIS